MTKKNNNIDNYKIENTENSLIFLLGSVTISNAFAYRKLFLEIDSSKDIILDLKNIGEFDSYLIVLINKLEKIAKKNNTELSIINKSDDLVSFINALKTKKEYKVEPKHIPGKVQLFFINLGLEVTEIAKDMYLFISFIGEIILKFLNILIRPTDMRWKDVPQHFTRSGVNALPITILIMFLIGIITGYQGALQLKQFGADIYIADVIGVSLSRELTPLMVAILVAGRSGSSFAAEIGTMKVSEEIDALESMGLDTIKFLVLPRVLSVTLAMPFLVIICNVVGIAGGLVTALTTLEITVTGFVNQLQSALSFFDIFTGLFKSMIFGFMIASVGCFRGMLVKGGAESVGKYTTSAVVNSVLFVILVDSLFVFVFQALGI
jgi:phospholipid/cholesterol/gamma-HCH transport system permease protein